MKRLLITGVGGRIGQVLRKKLSGYADILRVSDIVDLGKAAPNEEVVPCDLADLEAVISLVKDVDGILHLGGISSENSFEAILDANIRGTYNIFEAARRCGGPRILFASSYHVVGFHPIDARLDENTPYRPDTLYGVSKVYGEALAQLYFDKFGVQSVSVRIGSCFEKVMRPRMLDTWFSHDDFASLVAHVFRAKSVNCTRMYGISNSASMLWDNSHMSFLDWAPKDNSESFRAQILKEEIQDIQSSNQKYHGTFFAEQGHFEDKQ